MNSAFQQTKFGTIKINDGIVLYFVRWRPKRISCPELIRDWMANEELIMQETYLTDLVAMPESNRTLFTRTEAGRTT